MSTEPLNILVCTKFVPDPNQLAVDADGRPSIERTPFRINTFDENAIEAAAQLCAKRAGSRAFGLSVIGPTMPPRDVFLRSLAMGLTSLTIVRDEGRTASDPLRLATVLAAGARALQEAEGIARWDLVICGEASADEYNAQTGPRLAEALGIPAITYATKLDVEGDLLLADRDLEAVSESVEVDLPALATVGTAINQVRIPTVLQIMTAGKKPIREIPVDTLPGLDLASLSCRPSVRTVDISAPPSARKHVLIEGKSPAEVAGELVRRLVAEGEVTL